MNVDHAVTRRTALISVAVAGGAVAAACSSSAKSNSPLHPGSPGSGSPAAAGSADASGVKLTTLDAITVGQAVSAKLPDGSPVIVARPTGTTAACFSAICTHMGCTVAPAGTQLHCPCHGSVYNATTGAVIHGPAPRPLPSIAVHVAAGEVVTG
jgi:cytochrome b6-f complex iron-sulfur subunit